MNPLTVGVVEDDSVMSGIICVLLKTLGYNVIQPAVCYQSAIKMLEVNKPDILLLDINLGDSQDGIEVAKFVRTNSSIPIIFLTAFALETTIEKAKQVHPEAFLLKPFTKDDLYSSIEIAINNFRNLFRYNNQKSHESILVKDGHDYVKIKFAEILYLVSDHNYVTFYLQNGKKIMMRSTMHEIMNKLPQDYFLRLNRSNILNLKHVTRLDTNKVLINDVDFLVTKLNHDIILEKISSFL